MSKAYTCDDKTWQKRVLYKDMPRGLKQVISWQMRWGYLSPYVDLRSELFYETDLQILSRLVRDQEESPLDIEPFVIDEAAQPGEDS